MTDFPLLNSQMTVSQKLRKAPDELYLLLWEHLLFFTLVLGQKGNSSRLKHKLTVYCCCCCFCFVVLLFCFVLFVCLTSGQVLVTENRTEWPRVEGFIWSNRLAQAGPPSAGCPGPCPNGFWTPPGRETAHTLWVTCRSALSLSQQACSFPSAGLCILLVELHNVHVSPFLQLVQVFLDSSMTLWHIIHSKDCLCKSADEEKFVLSLFCKSNIWFSVNEINFNTQAMESKFPPCD